MSKNPYTAGRLVVYAVAAIVMGLGSTGAFADCDGKKETPVCTHDRDGNPNCPLQTGEQRP